METLYTCDKCKKKYAAKDMRYSIDGKKFLCTECLKIGKPISSEPQKAVQKKIAKVAFTCTACKYKWTAVIRQKNCPYCGKSTVVEDKAPTADKLINESSGFD